MPLRNSLQEPRFHDSLTIWQRRFDYIRPGSDIPAPASAEAAVATVEFLLQHAAAMRERGCNSLVELQCGFGYRTAALGYFLQGSLNFAAMDENAQLLHAARQNCSQNGVSVSLCKGALHDLACLLEPENAPDVLIASSSRSGGLGEAFFGFVAGTKVKEVLYLSAGRMSAQQDLPKLTKLGFEVRSLQIADPMPGTDHVEIRVHLCRNDLEGCTQWKLLTLDSASMSWPKCDWHCAACDNLVFRRHIHRCPRCGSLRDVQAVARLQQKAELSTVIKAVQKAPDIREKWLEHCQANGLGKNPMLNAHSSNIKFLTQNLDAPCLATYGAVLRKHGILSSSCDVQESNEVPALQISRTSTRKLLIISAKTADWALQTAAQAMQALRAKSIVSASNVAPSRWVWASFDHKTQPPPHRAEAEGEWQWVDVKNAEQLLGTECEVCVLVCIPHLHADALGALAGLILGGGLLVLVVTDGSEAGHGSRRTALKAGEGDSPSKKLFWKTPFDVRFGTILQDCPHTLLDHLAGSCMHFPKISGSLEHAETQSERTCVTSSPILPGILCQTPDQAAAVEAPWQGRSRHVPRRFSFRTQKLQKRIHSPGLTGG